MKKPLKVGVLKAFTDFLIAQEPYAKWKRGKKHRTKLGIDEETFRFILGLVDEKVRRIHGKKIRTEHTSYLTNENLLALLFNWLREYRTKASLAIDFNIPDTTVQDYLRILYMMQSSSLYALRQEFNGELQMVRSQERVYLLILILFLLKLVRVRRKIERSITGTLVEEHNIGPLNFKWHWERTEEYGTPSIFTIHSTTLLW